MYGRSHAKRDLIILAIAATIFIVGTQTTVEADRGLIGLMLFFVVLAPAVLTVLLLHRSDRDKALRARLTANTVSASVVACTGYDLPRSTSVLLTVRAEGVTLTYPSGPTYRVAMSDILGLAFGGPGRQVTSVSVTGYGVDLGPVGVGSAGASVQTETNTFVHVTSTRGAFTIHTADADPAELEAVFADALLVLRHRRDTAAHAVPAPRAAPAGADRIAHLEKLAALRASGVLSDAEFTAEKARILSAGGS